MTHPKSEMPLAATPDTVASLIQTVRGQRVLIDSDLSSLYGVPTRSINQAVVRNPGRFPPDFVMQLTAEECLNLRSHPVSTRWGGRRTPPRAFTEQGVAMLSSVLRSPQAVVVNVAIMRAFVRLRRVLAECSQLSVRVTDLEAKTHDHDRQIDAVFEAIRLMLSQPDSEPKSRMGFERE